jgi:hypothetical protein
MSFSFWAVDYLMMMSVTATEMSQCWFAGDEWNEVAKGNGFNN